MNARQATGCALLAALAVCLRAVPVRAQQLTGSIEVVVRVTPSGGRPQPARGLPLFLLKKSYRDIRKEAEETEPRPELEKFLESLEFSPELKDWMKRHRVATFSGEEFQRRLTVNDLLGIPEFYDAYLRRNAGDSSVGFPEPKFRERDRERNPQRYEKQVREYRENLRKFLTANPHTMDGLEIQLVEMDPGHRWARQESEWRERVRQRAQRLAEGDYRVARFETDLEGRAGLVGVAPGEYWLTTLELEAVAGEVRLRWDAPVEVRAGQAARIELSNINAVPRNRPGG